MMTKTMGGALVLLLGVAGALVGCSSDPQQTDPGLSAYPVSTNPGSCAHPPCASGSSGSAGGSSGSSGSGSSGGGSSSGGGGGTVACPYTGPALIDPASLPACGGAGSAAHCLGTSFVPAALHAQLASCSGGYCVPDKLITTAGQYIPKTCTSLAGAEGRCMGTVLPAISAEATTLPQAECDTSERCAPCYDPLTGKDTGVCKVACDPGPTQPAKTFAACCGGQAKCIPTSTIPSSALPNLYTANCKAGAEACVPNDFLVKPINTQRCSGSIFLVGDYDGVCLSNCLNLGSSADSLDQGNCDGAHTCVPCINPATGDPTGAPGC